MYQIGQTPLAKLRPEKLDDAALKEQISLIQEICRDIDPDKIAIIFHECDYNIQTTIARIKSGDIEDGGWQKAKSNHKKKNHHINTNDQLSTNDIQSDGERSHSQHTSPTSSLRGGINREHQQMNADLSLHSNLNRRTDDDSQQKIIDTHYTNDNIKSTEITSSSKINDETINSSSINETIQTLTLNDNQKKSSLSSLIKQSTSSSIRRQAVEMHPTIRFSTKPIDIQFGDIQWNDSVPIFITPSNSPIITKSSDEQILDTQDESSTNLRDRELHETTTSGLSSTSFEISNNPLMNNSTEEISHLSDRINDSSQQITSPSNSTSQTHQIIPNTNSSAFTPYGTSTSAYQSLSRDYSQTWNPQQSPNFKTNAKTTMIQTGTYPPSAYSLQHQPQFYFGPLPYQTQYYPVITSVDSWSNTGSESYQPYATNYVPSYPTQQQYYPNTTRQDAYLYDKDLYTNYGQSRLNNTNNNSELSNPSQSTKETPLNSKLSATAASFSQATSPTSTVFMNPILYSFPSYYSPQQDRTMTYPSMDNRDYRNGASYSGNNRTQYYPQQRTHQNSTWY